MVVVVDCVAVVARFAHVLAAVVVHETALDTVVLTTDQERKVSEELVAPLAFQPAAPGNAGGMRPGCSSKAPVDLASDFADKRSETARAG